MRKKVSILILIIMCGVCTLIFYGCKDKPKDFEITKEKSTGYLIDFSIRFTDENELYNKESFSYRYVVNSGYDGNYYIVKGENTINGGTIKKEDSIKRYPKRFKLSKTNSIMGSPRCTFLFQTEIQSPPVSSTSEIFERHMKGNDKTFYNDVKTYEDLENNNGIIAFHVITNGNTSNKDYNYYLDDPDMIILIAVQINISQN